MQTDRLLLTGDGVGTLARRAGVVLLGFLGALAQAGTPNSPVGVTATLGRGGGPPVAEFRFDIPQDHRIYAERLKFETADGTVLVPRKISDPVTVRDKVSGEETGANSQFRGGRNMNSLFVSSLIQLLQQRAG